MRFTVPGPRTSRENVTSAWRTLFHILGRYPQLIPRCCGNGHAAATLRPFALLYRSVRLRKKKGGYAPMSKDIRTKTYLFRLRRMRRLSQKQFAALLGLRSPKAIGKYEHGTRLPPLRIAMQMEIVLGTKL